MQTLDQNSCAAWPPRSGGAPFPLEAFIPPIRLEEDGVGRAYDSQVCVPTPYLSQRNVGPAILLQVTSDLSLGRTREEILQRAGLDVLTISEADAWSYVDAREFAIALFCQTIRRERAVAISNVFCKKNPRPFIARLTFTPHLDHCAFDAVLSTPVTPSTLVSEAARWKSSFDRGLDLQ